MTILRPPDDWDPATPMTSEERARGHLATLARRARRATGLSEEGFASTYGIPLPTVRAWENGQDVGEPATLAYLRVITAMPEEVAAVIRVA